MGSYMKSQVSTEFMAIFIIFIIALTVAVYAGLINTKEITKAKKDLEAQEFIFDIAETINTVYLEGDGFSMNLTLPERISGLQYSVFIDSNYLLLNLSGNFYQQLLLTKNISGVLKPGINFLKNHNGTIVITQVK